MTPISPNIQKSATAHQQQTNLGGSLAIGSIITSAPATTNNNGVSSTTNSFELTGTTIQTATVGKKIELISKDCT